MLAVLAVVAALHAPMPELKISSPPFTQAYCSLRAEAESPEAGGQAETFRKLIAKLDAGTEPGRARALSLSLLDALVVACAEPADLEKVVNGLPADWRRSNLTRDWLKEASGVIGGYFAAFSQPADMNDQLKKTGDEVKAAFPKPWAWLEAKLGIEDAPKNIEVILVPTFAAPGAVTLRTSEGVRVLVSTDFQGSALIEAVVHEAIHACEAGEGKVDVLARIRASEKLAGEHRQNLPHTLYFIAAADALRHSGWKDHTDVGVTHGVYERGLEPYRKHLEPLWKDYVSGKISRDIFVSLSAEIRASYLR